MTSSCLWEAVYSSYSSFSFCVCPPFVQKLCILKLKKKVLAKLLTETLAERYAKCTPSATVVLNGGSSVDIPPQKSTEQS